MSALTYGIRPAGRSIINSKSPFVIKWPISKTSLSAISNVSGQCLRSDSFNTKIDGVKYYIEIYPNGDTDEHLGETWIFLALEYSGKIKIEADFKISIPTANSTFKEKKIFEELGGHGIKICATDELFDKEKNFIVNDKMVIFIDGTLLFSKNVYNDNIYMKKAILEKHSESVFSGLWLQNTKDFTIVVEEKELKVHKCILAAQSPVFTKMFESGMKEAEENKVEIPDFSFKIVEAAIKFCYNIFACDKFSIDDKMKILQFFDKYEIQQLKENMENYLIKKIDDENVCLLANCSLLTNSLKLEEKCFEFLSNCAANKTPVNDFDLLDKDFALKLFKNSFYALSK